MKEYKSNKIVFFKKGKFVFLGDLVTPTIVKLFRKDKVNQVVIGRLIEYTIVTLFVLSVVYLIKLL